MKKLFLGYSKRILLTLPLLYAGCVTGDGQFLFTAPIVSGIKNGPPLPASDYEKGKYFKVTWCSGDKRYGRRFLVAVASRGGVGGGPLALVDEVVAKAHKSTGIDYFMNASFYSLGDCISMRSHKYIKKPKH